tara:strand:- start:27 stop:368 length:342 start_codon:yes stop_codon:yes gene_type:complete
MKNMVNHDLKQPTVSFDSLALKYKMFDHTINDVQLADVLMLFALTTQKQDEEPFMKFCHTVGSLMGGFYKGPFPVLLQYVDLPCTTSVLNCVNALRRNYGMNERSQSHYNVAE